MKFEIEGAITHEHEECLCAHMVLDDLGIPRQDAKGEVYSLVGRIKEMRRGLLKLASDMESSSLSTSQN